MELIIHRTEINDMRRNLYMKRQETNKIIIPKGKFCASTYCRDCFHLNFKDVTKDGEAAWCEIKRTYRCFDKDYNCSDWNK